MEVVLYNSTVCRLCGEENDNGTFLYSTEENNQNISDLVNAYLPIKVSDDGQLPRTICPGCTIQLEATVEFINLIVTGQKAIRGIYQREKEYKKKLSKTGLNESDTIVVEVDPSGSNGAYQEEHPISLQVAGLDKPKRKRGRPPKKIKPPEEQALEAAAVEQEVKKKQRNEEPTGKRRRKTPERFRGLVQGKELDQIFKEEGMTDGDESDNELKAEKCKTPKEAVPKVSEVIGHTVTGELVVIVKGKGRGRPKGRTKQTHETCAICGKDFSNSGRYMSHIAQHGPVLYQCQQCTEPFPIRLDFNNHQQETGHQGLNILPGVKEDEDIISEAVEPIPEPCDKLQPPPELFSTPELVKMDDNMVGPVGSLPDLNPQPMEAVNEDFQELDCGNESELKKELTAGITELPIETSPKKPKLKCPHCDKKYSSKQAKSMHIKAVHKGERPYICNECGVSFAYPRALSLHSLAHRRRNNSKGFACDLCGKVLNHPSSVAYHKEAEHANQQYVCYKCGKSFKHKQLLQRHQLVHTQLRPFLCKVCNAKFKTKANLINHQMLHTGVKKFSCEECKQRFAHKTSLTLHMRWHKGQKPYACKICDKAFTQKGNLSEHMRIHTGEKPFQCALCPRKFTTSSQHRLHLRRHEPKAHRLNVRPTITTSEEGATIMSENGSLIHFTINSSDVTSTDNIAVTSVANSGAAHGCPRCGRAFASRWTLAKHARLHSAERPLACPHCARRFADASNLNKHKKQVHKQTSLLAVQPLPPLVPALSLPLETDESQYVVETEDSEERVIYVTYDVDSHVDDYQIMEAEQCEEPLESPKGSELFSGESLLLQTKPLHEQEHMSVTDEEGNPLHFTMQDGTRLAITSLDGQSLQVITQDGQTIPVEINGFPQDDEESQMQDVSVHELDLKDDDPGSPVTHYYTIV